MKILFNNALYQQIKKESKKRPDKVALEDTNGKKIIFRDFIKKVDQVACQLIAKGVLRGDRVLFLHRPTIEGIIYFFAICRAGGVIVIADPVMGQDVFVSRVKLANPKYIIQDSVVGFVAKVPFLFKIFKIFGYDIPYVDNKMFVRENVITVGDLKSQSQENFKESKIDSSEEALVVFTSGTINLPKGVVHTFESLIMMLKFVSNEITINKEDVFFATQLYFVLVSLLNGVTSVLNNNPGKFNASKYISIVKQYAVTKTFILPKEGEELINKLQKTSEKLPASLNTIFFGSAPVLVGFLKRFKKNIHNNTIVKCIYGATEILPIAIVDGNTKLEYSGKGDLLGNVIDGIDIQIVDNEIYVRGKNMCKRYLHRDGELQTYITGDLGFYDKKYGLVLTGRKKDMIIKGNHNIYPSLFEATISTIDGVGMCALVGVYDKKISDEKIYLFIENVSDVYNDKQLIKNVWSEVKYGKKSIDVYAIPDKIICTIIPVSGRSRKINKDMLKKMIL